MIALEAQNYFDQTNVIVITLMTEAECKDLIKVSSFIGKDKT